MTGRFLASSLPGLLLRRTCSNRALNVPNYFDTRVRPYMQLDEIRPDVYQATNLTTNQQAAINQAYGGLVFAQAVAAAEKSVPDTGAYYPHSSHVFFIQGVDTRKPVEYHIGRCRDGSSFFTRRVDAIQKGEMVFTGLISFNKEEPHSIRHQVPMPNVLTWSEIPNIKKDLPELMKLIKKSDNKWLKRFGKWVNNYLGSKELFDVRLVPTDPADPNRHRYWFRAAGQVPECNRTHRFLFAYITDSVMWVSAIRSHVMANTFGPSLMGSLDNSTWFHDPKPRVDQWFLIEVETPVAGYSRGFTMARVFSEDGRHLMSTTQDLLIRGQPSEV